MEINSGKINLRFIYSSACDLKIKGWERFYVIERHVKRNIHMNISDPRVS